MPNPSLRSEMKMSRGSDAVAAAHGSRSVQLGVRRNAVEVEPKPNQDPGAVVQEIVQQVVEEVARQEARQEVVEVVRGVREVVKEVLGRCWRSSRSRQMSNGRV